MELRVGHPVLLPPSGGELIGDSENRRLEILADGDELHATWSRFGPRRPGASPHVHRSHSDLFYVLAGELTVLLGPERVESVFPAGTLVLAPPLVVHGFRNGSDAEVRYLNFHAPGGGFADYLRAGRDGRPGSFDSEDPPPDGGRPADEAVVAAGGLLVDRSEIRIEEVRLDSGSTARGGQDDRLAQFFYVLAGTLTLSLGDDELRAETGAWLQVPAGVAATLAASGSAGARYLDIRVPLVTESSGPESA
jgi:quercetin dioxygenase-like cupin family protein